MFVLAVIAAVVIVRASILTLDTIAIRLQFKMPKFGIAVDP